MKRRSRGAFYKGRVNTEFPKQKLDRHLEKKGQSIWVVVSKTVSKKRERERGREVMKEEDGGRSHEASESWRFSCTKRMAGFSLYLKTKKITDCSWKNDCRRV